MNIGHWVSGVSPPSMDYFECLEDETKGLLERVIEVKFRNVKGGGEVFKNQTVKNMLSYSDYESIDLSEECSKIHNHCNPKSGDSFHGSGCGKKTPTKIPSTKKISETMTNSEFGALVAILVTIMIPWTICSYFLCCYYKCFIFNRCCGE